MSMSPSEFKYLSGLIKDESGIQLKEDKIYLLEARLLPLLKKLMINDLSELVEKLQSKKDLKVTKSVINAMTTNETLFFRDGSPFENFQNIIMPHLKNKISEGRKIRILCLGCSTGQEPYSLAINITENKAKWEKQEFEILGLDICDDAIEKAGKGVYTQFEVQRGMPITLLLKYFTKENDEWVIKKEIKSRVEFKVHNAIQPLDRFGKFDVVFCRNMLIYFDLGTKARVVSNVANVLNHNGVLFIGGSETLYGVYDGLKPFVYENNKIKGVYCT